MTTFTTEQVSKIGKISIRQLQWWDKQNVLSPLNNGRLRAYTVEQAAGAALFGELRRRGVSLQRIRRIAPTIDTSALLTNSYFLMDGCAAYLENRPEKAIRMICCNRRAITAIYLPDIIGRIR